VHHRLSKLDVFSIVKSTQWDDRLYKSLLGFPAFVEKLAEAQRRFATLQNELQSSLDAQRESSAPAGLRKRKTVFHLSQEERCKHRNIKDLQLAFSEFYLSLILLQNYQVLLYYSHTQSYRHTHRVIQTHTPLKQDYLSVNILSDILSKYPVDFVEDLIST